MYFFMQFKASISSAAHRGYGNRPHAFLVIMSHFPLCFSPCLLFYGLTNSNSLIFLGNSHFQDFCLLLDTLQSDHMFLYKCHLKHAFSTGKEKAIPISWRDTASALKYWIHQSSTDWDKIQIKTMHEN